LSTRRARAYLAALVFVVYLLYNGIAAVSKQGQASLITKHSNYGHYPTCMYIGDDPQVIGLPPYFAPGLSPSQYKVKVALKDFKRHWHPDHCIPNSFAPDAEGRVEAEKAFARGISWANAVLEWYENPYCHKNTRLLDNIRHDTKALLNSTTTTIEDGLPHFAPGCKCTQPRAYANHLYTILVPSIWQSPPPQTPFELARFCPCDLKMAWRNKENRHRENLPPSKMERNCVLYETMKFSGWSYLDIPRWFIWWNAGRRGCENAYRPETTRREVGEAWEAAGWATKPDYEIGRQGCEE
jgi:hypothetical protein